MCWVWRSRGGLQSTGGCDNRYTAWVVVVFRVREAGYGEVSAGSGSVKPGDHAFDDVVVQLHHGSGSTGMNACLFCVGVSPSGRRKAKCICITHDRPLADALNAASPPLALVYALDEGTNSTGTSCRTRASAEGRAENDILALPMPACGAGPD